MERAIDDAIVDCGLSVVLRTSLSKFPGCAHWHLKRGRESGTLEITFWPQEHRAWFSIHDGRKAEWIDAMISTLLEAIGRPLLVTLRPITPALVGTFKATRLSALQDSPLAFGSTFAGEVQLSDDDWRQRAAKWNSERSAGFLAFDGDDACGIVAAFLDENDAAKAHLVSMWVAPAQRQRGIGRMLVRAIIDWADSKAARKLYLMVTSTNAAATRFYERLGFVKTGRTEPYSNDRSLVEYEMARRLGPGQST